MDTALKNQSGGSLSCPSSGIETPSGHVYTDEEKHAVLGRHNVYKLNISTGYLLGTGALGALMGAAVGGIAKTFSNYSLNTVALAGVGTTLGVLTAVASAKAMTPLEHARHELEQVMADEAFLLENQMDKPDYQFCSTDTFVIRDMAIKYQESWRPLWLLWAGIYSPAHWNDKTAFRDELYLEVMSYGAGKEEIIFVGNSMDLASSLATAKELPEFKYLTKKLKTPNEEKEGLAVLLLALNRLTAEQLGDYRDYSIDLLYQDLCKSQYSHYKARLEQDKSRLENDVRLLCAIEKERSDSV